jgi:hypothetical protein
MTSIQVSGSKRVSRWTISGEAVLLQQQSRDLPSELSLAGHLGSHGIEVCRRRMDTSNPALL